MRFRNTVLSALLGTAVLAPMPTLAYVMPYDPYPWCAVYGGRGGGGTNCGFLTIEQCRATVSGIGGFVRTQSILQSTAGERTHPQETVELACIDCSVRSCAISRPCSPDLSTSRIHCKRRSACISRDACAMPRSFTRARSRRRRIISTRSICLVSLRRKAARWAKRTD